MDNFSKREVLGMSNKNLNFHVIEGEDEVIVNTKEPGIIKQLLLFLAIIFFSTNLFIYVYKSFYEDSFLQWYNGGLVGGIYILIVLYLFKDLRNFLKKSLSFKPLKKISTYIYILFSFLISFSLIIYIYHMPLHATINLLTSPSKEYFNATDLQIFLFIVSTGIIGPIQEEILFRGLVLNVLRERYNSIFALLVVTFLFPLFHFSAGDSENLKYLFMVTIVGALASLLCLKTKSIWPGVLLHMIYNIFCMYYWNMI
jgi:membrane protease YdiL (CAAX protease family)